MNSLKIRITLFSLMLMLVGCAGENNRFPDRSGEPIFDESALEIVAELDMPPGNVTVTEAGRLFITFMPEAQPDTSIAEIVNGEPVPFPNADWQPSGDHPKKFSSVLPIRADQFNRLWAVDAGFHSLLRRVRILAFDLDTRDLVHEFLVPGLLMGHGAYANDFQISPDGKWLYISDSGILNRKPGLVVYDIENQEARRVLHNHPSVRAGNYIPLVQGREMHIPGVFALNPGVDGVALTRDGNTLYYGGFSNEYLYRISTAVLNDFDLSQSQVAAAVELVGEKTMSDGMTTDDDGNIYLTDAEHDAVIRMSPDGNMVTLFKTPVLRWPDGFSYGPDNKMYLSCSALHQVFARPNAFILRDGPYQIFKFDPGVSGTAGH